LFWLKERGREELQLDPPLPAPQRGGAKKSVLPDFGYSLGREDTHGNVRAGSPTERTQSTRLVERKKRTLEV